MNTTEHICRRAIAILRERQANLRVSAEDVAFSKSHIAACRQCLADSAMIREMMESQKNTVFNELAAHREAEVILSRLAELKGDDGDVAFENPFRRFALPIAGAAAASMLVGIYLLLSPLTSSREAERVSKVTAVAHQTQPQSATDDDTVEVAHLVSTSTAPGAIHRKDNPIIKVGNSAQKVLLRDGIRLLVQPGSELLLQQSDTLAITVALYRGQVVASVEPSRDGPIFSVQTKTGRVVVTGTIFSVVSEAGQERVTVLRGEVSVTDWTGAISAVSSGEQLLFSQRARAPVSSEELAAMARDADRLSNLDVSHQDYVDWRQPNTRESQNTEAGRSNGDQRQTGEPIASVKTGSKTPVSPHPMIRDLLLDVRRYRSARDWRMVADTYQRLIDRFPEREEAIAALVALGDVQLYNLNRPEAALVLYDRYIRYGRDTVMEEALIGRAHALRRLGRTDEERSALQGFVTRYTHSIHLHAVKNRLAEIANP